jgi:hypothetical protein
MMVPGKTSVHSVDFEQSPLEAIEQLPDSVTELLTAYDSLFAEPSSLPPPRSADHKIPLIPGAQPVKVRPYRYSPIQKTKIEKQLKYMLTQGVIRPSTSSFASPMLLVRKKDGT